MIGLKTLAQREAASKRKPLVLYPPTNRRWLSPKKARREKWRESALGTEKREKYNYEGRHPLERHMSVGAIQRRRTSGPKTFERLMKLLNAMGPDTSRRKEPDDDVKKRLRKRSQRREKERRKSRAQRQNAR